MNVGDVVTGKVARITSFGAFIDLGGVDGLVHLTELSHERNVSPKSVVTVGEEIQVKVLDLNEEEGRVSLSLKATTLDLGMALNKNWLLVMLSKELLNV